MAVLVLFGVFCGENSVNSHTGGATTKPIAVFRSGVIGDSRHIAGYRRTLVLDNHT
jgi:hypothetical protein